jgi:PIN domain nuclease of toxin-antitoxin system
MAIIRREPGFERVRETLKEGDANLIGVVNWAEVLSKAAERGASPEELDRQLRDSGFIGQEIQVRALDEAQALEIAKLRPLTRAFGLSLGDRACLALAMAEGAKVLTADKGWSQLKLGVSITVIR